MDDYESLQFYCVYVNIFLHFKYIAMNVINRIILLGINLVTHGKPSTMLKVVVIIFYPYNHVQCKKWGVCIAQYLNPLYNKNTHLKVRLLHGQMLFWQFGIELIHIEICHSTNQFAVVTCNDCFAKKTKKNIILVDIFCRAYSMCLQNT